MEEYDLGFGSILYSTALPGLDGPAVLTVNEPHDFAQIFIDGEYVGKLDQLLVKKRVTHREPGQSLDLSGETPVHEGAFRPGNGWQESRFTPVRGRYVCIEALNALDGGAMAAIAEMYLLDDKGDRLSREPWTVVYADSEDMDGVKRSADKTFDLQESTYWQTAAGAPFPHAIVIDLGASHNISGFQYLPRMENGVPGGIKNFRIYVKDTDFSLSQDK